MKTVKKFRLWIAMLGLFIGFAASFTASAQVGVNVSFQTFYDQLSPYGYWINTPNYGYVWSPNVTADFQPYVSNGYWVMTEYGNTWVSDYDWGWAPFHYGRWYYDDYNGWLWAPDTEWGPAWVEWRTGNGYYGWMPMSPSWYVNVSINRWTFLPYRYITHRHFHSYCLPRTRVVNVYNQTTVINNYYTYNNRRYVSGPSVRDIERNSRSRVQVRQIRDEARPGRAVVNNGDVRVYRPTVESRGNSAPARITNNPRRNDSGVTERSGENFPTRSGREGFNTTERSRSNQMEEPTRGNSGARSGGMERENPTRSQREQLDRNRMEPNRTEGVREFPTDRNSGGSMNRRSESVQPQERSERRSMESQPSIDRGARRPDWGDNNSGSGSGGSNTRSMQPREQRQFEPQPQQRRSEPAPSQPTQRSERSGRVEQPSSQGRSGGAAERGHRNPR